MSAARGTCPSAQRACPCRARHTDEARNAEHAFACRVLAAPLVRPTKEPLTSTDSHWGRYGWFRPWGSEAMKIPRAALFRSPEGLQHV
eukprot:1790898-Pyramimonas_sp.AAC.1